MFWVGMSAELIQDLIHFGISFHVPYCEYEFSTKTMRLMIFKFNQIVNLTLRLYSLFSI